MMNERRFVMRLLHWKELHTYDPLVYRVVSGFMESRDVMHIPTGRYDLESGCYVNVDCYETRDNFLFEGHKKFVDVQLMLDGEEEMFCAPLRQGALETPYDEQKDCWFFTCKAPFTTLHVTQGLAAVLEPQDLHAPCNWKEKRQNRKLVFKIPVALLQK